MNATESTLLSYIETLHKAVQDVGQRALGTEQSTRLLHNALLPATVTGYVSTQFGIAIEYEPAAETSIRTVRGSARVEDLIFSGPKALRAIEPMLLVRGNNCGLSTPGGGFVDAFPFRLADSECDITVEDANFEVVFLGWKRHVHYLEVYGNRALENWSLERASMRAKDEVLAAIYLSNQAAKSRLSLADFITKFKDKYVLLLGSYSLDGRQRLDAISCALTQFGYVPVLVADVPDFEHYDLAQKVVAIASVCRFVVVDDSAPSGHLNEIEICRANRWVTILLRQDGKAASSMTLGASISSNVIREVAYTIDTLAAVVGSATGWAEGCLERISAQYRVAYPFRA